MLTDIPEFLILPYWVIILLIIINVISIYLESSTKSHGKLTSGSQTIEDIQRRDNIKIIARIYLVIIYCAFFLFDTSSDWRAFFGRWGIFGLLFLDSYCNIANYIDFNWTKVTATICKLKIKIFNHHKINDKI